VEVKACDSLPGLTRPRPSPGPACAPVEAELREAHRPALFSAADDEQPGSVVLELLRQRGRRLAVAESCHRWGPRCLPWPGVAGASDVFLGRRDFLPANRIKQELMEVPAGTLAA